MPDESAPAYCGQCGSPVQMGDRFCGTCGAAILVPAPQAEQIIPQPVAAAQGSTTSSRKTLLIAGVLGALAVLLVGGGALALVGLSGNGLLGTSEREPAGSGDSKGKMAGPKPDTVQLPTPSQESTYQGPGNSSISVDPEATTGKPTVSASPEATMSPTTQSAPPGSGQNGTASPGLEAEAEQAARNYYDAAENGDWKYTYRHLYYLDKGRYTFDEWVTANEGAGTASSTFQIDSVHAVDTDLGAPAVEVGLTIYTANGGTVTRITRFYLIDGLWEHVLTDEERALFDKYV